MMRIFFFSILIFAITVDLSAQSANATELMNKGCYAEAAALFDKATTGNNPEYSDLTSLASVSYTHLRAHETHH